MRLPKSAQLRLLIALILGAGAGAAASLVDLTFGFLVGIAVASTFFVLAGWAVIWPMDAKETRDHVNRENYSPLGDELVVLTAVVAGLGGIVALQMSPKHFVALESLLTVVAVFMTWGCLHFMYAVRYADTYDAESGGIDFNTKEDPQFSDFLYFSYNLGMTYQVSDTGVSSKDLRKIILRHCLLSYVFGVTILATAINLAVNFVSG